MTTETRTEPRYETFTSHWGTTWRVNLDDVMFGKPWATKLDGTCGGRYDRALLPRHIRAMLPKGPFDTD